MSIFYSFKMINRLKEKLFAPINIYSLVFVRIAFGLTMFVNTIMYFSHDLINYSYIQPIFYFKYYGFSWVTMLPADLLTLLFIILAILAIFIAIGAFYRISSVLFLLGFTYIFLLDQTLYLNHYYMIILFNFLLCFMPANRFLAIDSHYINPKIKTEIIPAWSIILLRIQLEIVLLYAGIVKINPDWLQLYPLKMWFSNHGPFFSHIWVVFIASYGSILLHILGAPLLLFKRTRIWIFLFYAVFHSTNAYLFNIAIGVFPWITLALTTIFFQPHWPIQFLYFTKNLRNFNLTEISKIYKESSNLKCKIPQSEKFKFSSNQKNLIITLIIIWSIFQILFPLRKLLYQGNSTWTQQGSHFSWQMKLNNWEGSTLFRIKDNKINRYLRDSGEPRLSYLPGELHHLTYKQANRLVCQPSMILQYAHFLKKIWSKKMGHDDISIYAIAPCSLNGRNPKLLIDPKVDLSKEEEDFSSPKWILPLDKNLKVGEYVVKRKEVRERAMIKNFSFKK